MLPGGAGGAGGQPQAGAFRQAAAAQVSHAMAALPGTRADREVLFSCWLCGRSDWRLG